MELDAASAYRLGAMRSILFPRPRCQSLFRRPMTLLVILIVGLLVASVVRTMLDEPL